MDIQTKDGILLRNIPDDTPDEVIKQRIAQIRQQSKPEPSTGRVGLNAVNKGIAGGIDAVLNTPTNLVNLVKAGVGYKMGEIGVPAEYMPEVSPPPNYARRGMEAAGFVKPEFEPQNRVQRIVNALGEGAGAGLASPAGSIPALASNVTSGVISGGASGVTKEATGSDTAAQIAGMLAPAGLRSAVDYSKSKALSKELEKQQNTVRDETLKAGQAEGYKVPVSTIKDGGVNDFIESVGGKAAIKQDLQRQNDQVTKRLAAEELRMPPGKAMEKSDLDAFRDKQAWPYREASAISKTAELTVEKLKKARFDKNALHKFYDKQGNPATLDEIKALQALETQLENRLVKIVTQAGKPQLVDELKSSRREIAKAHSIENVLNKGDASISAPALASALERGEPLSGNLLTIAKFAAGPGQQVVREQGAIQAPGVSQLKAYAAMAGGGGGAAVDGKLGATIGSLIPFTSNYARKLATSDMYQKLMANPNYSPGMIKSLMAKLSADEQQALMQSLTQGNRLANELESR